MNRYIATVRAAWEGEEELYLGHVVVSAKDTREARRLAMDALWDARLDSSSAMARVSVTRMGKETEEAR